MMIDLNSIYLKREAESRSLSAENPKGEKGKGGMADPNDPLTVSGAHARDLGQKWKVNPYIKIPPHSSVTLMDNEGPGVIRHIWMTTASTTTRHLILRIYWDGQKDPSVECPVGDFFCNSWRERQNILGTPINVNPLGGMNCFFPMPFNKHARITLTNESPTLEPSLYYTINYTLEKVPADALYFHAHWRRTNPLPYKEDYVMIDGIRGQGQYVGAFLAWQTNNKWWWGEGEVKMFVDGDTEYPTICGTGTEDYFGGAWNFGMKNFSAACFGYQLVTGEYERPGARHIMYRFHMHDPVFFRENLKVTIQALGWRSEGRYLALQDDIASVVYWYQTLPHQPFGPFPARDYCEII